MKPTDFGQLTAEPIREFRVRERDNSPFRGNSSYFVEAFREFRERDVFQDFETSYGLEGVVAKGKVGDRSQDVRSKIDKDIKGHYIDSPVPQVVCHKSASRSDFKDLGGVQAVELSSLMPVTAEPRFGIVIDVLVALELASWR